MDRIIINTFNYPFVNWNQYLRDNGSIKLKDLLKNYDWIEFFESIEDTQYYKNIEKDLTELAANNKDFFPYPELLFYSLNILSPEDIKVVIIGQDPYHSVEEIPIAMGASFSVPIGCKIPSSLMSIYSNMIKHNHIKELPSHGNLVWIISQGIFMINTYLTVLNGIPKSHRKIWSQFTRDLFEWLDEKINPSVIVLWGADALGMKMLFNNDPKKHRFVISSHPSGLGCNQNLGNYPSFNSVDHLGEINKNLKELKLNPIFPLF